MSDTELEVNLKDLIDKVEQWRSNKKSQGEKMPENLWKEITELYQIYPEQSKFIRFLGLSKTQIKNKLRESNDPVLFNDPVELCKINKIENQPPPVIAKDNFSPLSTIVVEFCRQDGCTMKIHTTTESIQNVIDKFLGGQNAENYQRA